MDSVADGVTYTGEGGAALQTGRFQYQFGKQVGRLEHGKHHLGLAGDRTPWYVPIDLPGGGMLLVSE